MRSEFEPVMLGESLLGMEFPTTKELMHEAYRAKSKELVDEKLDLLNEVYQDIVQQPDNGAFFGEPKVTKPEPGPTEPCWSCNGNGFMVESFVDHPRVIDHDGSLIPQPGVKKENKIKCDVCRGGGTINVANLGGSLNKHGHINTKVGQGVMPGYVPDHVK